jgi:hypothetical protein
MRCPHHTNRCLLEKSELLTLHADVCSVVDLVILSLSLKECTKNNTCGVPFSKKLMQKSSNFVLKKNRFYGRTWLISLAIDVLLVFAISLAIDVLLVCRVNVEKVEVRTDFEYITGTLVGKGNKRMSFVHAIRSSSVVGVCS